MQTLADLATDPDLDGSLPIIVAGDLNAAPNSPILRPLSDVLTDAWSAGTGDPAAVTPAVQPSFCTDRGERIDRPAYRPHLLPAGREWAQRLEVVSTMLAGEAVDGVYPSDHRAAVRRAELSPGAKEVGHRPRNRGLAIELRGRDGETAGVCSRLPYPAGE